MGRGDVKRGIRDRAGHGHATYDGVVRRRAGDITLHLLRIYTRRPIRINCTACRRKYVPKDIGARYYDANERSKRGGIHAWRRRRWRDSREVECTGICIN